VTDPLLRGHFVGCLVGLGVGDALGAPLEFMSRAEIADTYGEVRDFLGGGWLNLDPGEYTDDTQLALVITRSILARGKVDPGDIAAEFVAWLRSGPKDAGYITRTAIRYHEQGQPWAEVGARVAQEIAGRAAGNGSLTRSAPLGLFHARRPEALLRDGRLVSELTHAHPYSVWSSLAANLAIGELLHGRREGMIERVAAQIPEGAVREVVRTAPCLKRKAVRSGGYVLETLGAALWALENHEGFEEVVIAAVNLGDDADGVGAVAGALAGAREGVAAIPSRWLEPLQGAEQLADLALGLHRLAVKP
jgi:ADP-ribosyl-[dinitrogen reductase] hydrolase